MTFQLDPANCTDYNRSDFDLELFFLFCIFVANKPAHRTVGVVNRFLELLQPPENSSSLLCNIDRMWSLTRRGAKLYDLLRRTRCGQYSRIYRALRDWQRLRPSLRVCSPQELERIHGVGCKTARFFILHSRQDANVAVLDTHVLKELAWRRETDPETRKLLRGLKIKKLPLNSPQDEKVYGQLERAVLTIAAQEGRTPAQWDLEVWNKWNQRWAGKIEA